MISVVIYSSYTKAIHLMSTLTIYILCFIHLLYPLRCGMCTLRFSLCHHSYKQSLTQQSLISPSLKTNHIKKQLVMLHRNHKALHPQDFPVSGNMFHYL